MALVFYETRSILRYYHPEDNGTVTLKADANLREKENFNNDEIKIIGRVDGRYTKF
jgi:hypothetical protein